MNVQIPWVTIHSRLNCLKTSNSTFSAVLCWSWHKCVTSPHLMMSLQTWWHQNLSGFAFISSISALRAAWTKNSSSDKFHDMKICFLVFFAGSIRFLWINWILLRFECFNLCIFANVFTLFRLLIHIRHVFAYRMHRFWTLIGTIARFRNKNGSFDTSLTSSLQQTFQLSVSVSRYFRIFAFVEPRIVSHFSECTIRTSFLYCAYFVFRIRIFASLSVA